jgi:hypothetical protein
VYLRGSSISLVIALILSSHLFPGQYTLSSQ